MPLDMQAHTYADISDPIDSADHSLLFELEKIYIRAETRYNLNSLHLVSCSDIREYGGGGGSWPEHKPIATAS